MHHFSAPKPWVLVWTIAGDTVVEVSYMLPSSTGSERTRAALGFRPSLLPCGSFTASQTHVWGEVSLTFFLYFLLLTGHNVADVSFPWVTAWHAAFLRTAAEEAFTVRTVCFVSVTAFLCRPLAQPHTSGASLHCSCLQQDDNNRPPPRGAGVSGHTQPVTLVGHALTHSYSVWEQINLIQIENITPLTTGQ